MREFRTLGFCAGGRPKGRSLPQPVRPTLGNGPLLQHVSSNLRSRDFRPDIRCHLQHSVIRPRYDGLCKLWCFGTRTTLSTSLGMA